MKNEDENDRHDKREEIRKIRRIITNMNIDINCKWCIDVKEEGGGGE